MSKSMDKKDMYLPGWVLGLGVFFFVCAAGVMGYALIFDMKHALYYAIGAVFCLAIGIAAVICHRNQWLRVISEDEFEYSTMFGNRKTYCFSQIDGIKVNPDSFTLTVCGDKIHVESCAVVSEKLLKKFEELEDRLAAEE